MRCIFDPIGIQSLPTRQLPVFLNFATSLLLNAVNFVIFRDTFMINPIFGLFSSRAIKDIPNLLSLMVSELMAAEVSEISKSGNTASSQEVPENIFRRRRYR